MFCKSPEQCVSSRIVIGNAFSPALYGFADINGDGTGIIRSAGLSNRTVLPKLPAVVKGIDSVTLKFSGRQSLNGLRDKFLGDMLADILVFKGIIWIHYDNTLLYPLRTKDTEKN